jgi:hypothetical protein
VSGGEAAYARAIERCWSGALERPVVLSPRDWALISDWFARSIPLGIVEEAIQQIVATRTRRGSSPPRALGYIAAAVEEAWSVVVEGRRAEIEPSARSSRPPERSALECWRRRAAQEAADSPLGRLLRELIAQQAEGAPAEEVDRRLASGLAAAVPEALLQSTRADVGRQLAGFRERMDDRVFRATRERAIIAHLRRALDLPTIGERDSEDSELE